MTGPSALVRRAPSATYPGGDGFGIAVRTIVVGQSIWTVTDPSWAMHAGQEPPVYAMVGP